jgi:hypothetical protein
VARVALERFAFLRKVLLQMRRVIEDNSRSSLVRPEAKTRMVRSKTVVTLCVAGLATGIIDCCEIVIGASMFVMANRTGDLFLLIGRTAADQPQKLIHSTSPPVADLLQPIWRYAVRQKCRLCVD